MEVGSPDIRSKPVDVEGLSHSLCAQADSEFMKDIGAQLVQTLKDGNDMDMSDSDSDSEAVASFSPGKQLLRSTSFPSGTSIAELSKPEGSPLPLWLRETQSSPPEALSRTVQQIEDDIRAAVDSAVARANQELGDRERFEQELSAAAAYNVAPSFDTTAAIPFIEPEIEVHGAPELLLLMEVVIGDGRSGTIEIHVGDQPDVLAAAFALKHSLKPEVVPRLTQHIQDQLDALTEAEYEAAAPDELETIALPPPAPVMATRAPEPQVAVSEPCKPAVEEAAPPALAPEVFAPPDDFAEQRESHWEKQAREHTREFSYNSLMAKYGHYTQHSGKVDPSITPDSTGKDGSSSPLTFHHVQLADYNRVDLSERHQMFSAGHTMTQSAAGSGASSRQKDKTPAVFNRLYALAESKDKWIKRAQKIKAVEAQREQDQMRVEMAAKSKDLIAHRKNGGYAHIGERLYEEALCEMAKKDKLRERRAVEKEEQMDWMCPRCATVNNHNDEVCKNVVRVSSSSGSSTENQDLLTRIKSPRESVCGSGFQDLPEGVCGQPRPAQLFRPTLLTASSSAQHNLQTNKERCAQTMSMRRQRNQQAMEDEFKKTCPFRPKINEVSEEIVRERLENQQASVVSSGGPTTEVTTTADGELRRKNPHRALYEEFFQVRAHREELKRDYFKQFPFKPNIGVNSLWMGNSDTDVVERLAVSKYHELEQKRLSLHEKYAPDRDPETGREYFKPEIGRAPMFNRNEKGLPIGEFLYESHREKQEYQRVLGQQHLTHIKQQAQQGFVSSASRQALASRKQKTFDRIFNALVAASRSSEEPVPHNETSMRDAEGTSKEDPPVVHPLRVDKEQLPVEISRIVSIAFEFADQQPFTRTQFAGYMEKIMDEVPGLTYTQVLFLTEYLNDRQSSRTANTGKDPIAEAAEEAELTFHPTIDKNSSLIAKKHGRGDRSKVFVALNQYFEHYKQKKEQFRKQQRREFDRAHPFQPTLVAKSRRNTSEQFYDKVKRFDADSGGSNSSGPSSPHLQTALTHARPCVRPIDTEYTEPRLDTRSSSRSSSQFQEEPAQTQEDDAELTSRVLAALDETPSQPAKVLQLLRNESKDTSTRLASAVPGTDEVFHDALSGAAASSLTDLASC